MLPNVPASAPVTDLDPLIVTAPTIRSGTTLLQRLLCSSPRAIIFGELAATDLEFFLNLYAVRVQEYTYNRSLHTRNLEQVLAGDANDWIPDLMPDLDGYIGALGQSAFAGIRYCRDYAESVGRPVWGFKYPGWKPPFIRLVRTLMPRARFIAITRGLEACVRSAKMQMPFNSLQDLRDLACAWKEGMAYWQSMGEDPAVCLLSYEELVAWPERVVDRLAAFAGVEDMQRDILQHKINRWSGRDPHAQTPDRYAPPAELTTAEQQVVDQVTGE